MDTKMAKFLVVLKALPTYLAAVSAVLTVVATQVVPLIPGPTGVQIGAWLATAVALLGSLVATISRLTPAAPGTEGLLPPTE